MHRSPPANIPCDKQSPESSFHIRVGNSQPFHKYESAKMHWSFALPSVFAENPLKFKELPSASFLTVTVF